MGYAWQRGLIPVSLEALLHAIELNAVAVDSNRLAFSLGRLAAADPKGCEDLLGAPFEEATDESLDALVARGVAHLTAYQNAAYAQRYADTVERVRQREAAVGADVSLPLSKAVARSLLKLMAYKDEYEVARLYTDGAFREALAHQFEGDVKLEFYMAPPLLARASNGQAPRKLRLGGWLLPALKVLALGKGLRGGAFDVFGHTAERRLERTLIGQYEARLMELLPALSADKIKLATEIATVPQTMRGYGHVKIANVALARAREAELLHRFDAKRYLRPATSAAAGQLRGIRVVAG